MKIKRSELVQLANRYIGNDFLEAQNQIMLKIATARCARLSYMTFDGEIDYEKDIELYDHLLENHHMSPFEHCARAMDSNEYHDVYIKGEIRKTFSGGPEGDTYQIPSITQGWCNNFKGFIPYRYLIENTKS